MSDILSSLLAGGFAGAAVVGALFKLIIQNQLERSAKRYQHELDSKKIELQSELSVFVESKKTHAVSFRQKRISALESAYSSVVSTSLPRHQFKKRPTKSPGNGPTDQQETMKYLHLFSENFQAFSRAFDSVVLAFEELEDHAIYLEPNLERRVADTLKNIQAFYMRHHESMRASYLNGMDALHDNVIPQVDRSFDFVQFHQTMVLAWNVETTALRQDLKHQVRSILRPENE